MLLLPSQRVLDAIGWDSSSHYHWTEFAVKGFDEHSSEFGCYSSYILGYIGTLREFYNINWGIIFTERFARRHHFDVVSDGLANCREHGCLENNSPSFFHGVFFGPLGICSGFKDSGGYFKRQESFWCSCLKRWESSWYHKQDQSTQAS